MRPNLRAALEGFGGLQRPSDCGAAAEPAGSGLLGVSGVLGSAAHGSVRRALLRAPLLLGLTAAAGGLTGCGFALRRSPALPFSRIAFSGFAPRSPMAAALRRELAQSVQVLEVAAQAEVVLVVQRDTRERTVVASTAAGQVRELQLRARLGFGVRTASGRELAAPTELMLQRDLSYNEANALAKEQEEAQLFHEMQSDLVRQVLRRLAALRLG